MPFPYIHAYSIIRPVPAILHRVRVANELHPVPKHKSIMHLQHGSQPNSSKPNHVIKYGLQTQWSGKDPILLFWIWLRFGKDIWNFLSLNTHNYQRCYQLNFSSGSFQWESPQCKSPLSDSSLLSFSFLFSMIAKCYL